MSLSLSRVAIQRQVTDLPRNRLKFPAARRTENSNDGSWDARLVRCSDLAVGYTTAIALGLDARFRPHPV